jgi:hypothetical protein
MPTHAQNATNAKVPGANTNVTRSIYLNMRARTVAPRRREGPLRSENISDQEVREIQSVAAGVIPDTLINIGSVVTGCPCEDGPQCTEQVWILGYRPGKIQGILLSRIDNHWAIGAVQQWWLGYEKLQDSKGKYKANWQYYQAEVEYQNTFPACQSELEKIMPKPTTTQKQTKK